MCGGLYQSLRRPAYESSVTKGCQVIAPGFRLGCAARSDSPSPEGATDVTTSTIVSPLRGSGGLRDPKPRAEARGYYMSPLCGSLLGQFVLLALCAISQAAEPLVLEGHTNVVASVAFSRDSSQLISGSWDRSVRVWNVETGKPIQTFSGHRDWVFDLVVKQDGSLLSASQNTIRHWRPAEEEVEVFGGLGGATVNAVAFSTDGRLVATGGRDGTVKVWQVGDDAPQAVFTGFESWVSCLAISPDHKTWVTATRGGHIRLFDLAEKQPGSELAAPSGQQVLALAINPAGDVLAAGGIDTTVRLFDLAGGKEAGKLTGHRGVITALAWSADGKQIASGDRHGPIKVWSYAGGNQLVATLPGHSDKQLGFTVTALAFSPNGSLLASGSYDKSVKVWKLADE